MALTTSTEYDVSTGLVTATFDANGQKTTFSYNDPLNRLKQVVRAETDAAAKNQSTYSYDDSALTITATSDLNTYEDNLLKTVMMYDGLGRMTETRTFEGGTNYIATQQQYDALGRNFKTSNPFRPWQSETPAWTTTTYDALGRVLTVTTPDNAVMTTSYSGNTLTVTDQALRKRKSITDALGRLIEVYEDPNGLNYQTTYLYDVLDDLVRVTQGSQQRFFMYDSLKRLLRARNPEQGTLGSLALSDPITGNSAWSLGYQYDANGNLTDKTDPRGVVSTYTYDALNRNTTVNFSDTTINPDVKRFYDGATNGKGRFWYFYSGGDFSTGPNVDHTSVDSYDALGRPLVQRQLFKLNNVWSAAYQITRTYNRAGGVQSQTYPSGHSVNYNYDAAGRLGDKDGLNLAFTGNLGDGVLRTYAKEVKYSSWGSLSREQYGTSTAVYHKLRYNIRGQLCDVRASNVNDDMGGELGALVNYYSTAWSQCGSGTDNNGNVLMSQTIINSVYFEDRYSYDALNRLTAVSEFQNGSTPSGSQQYSYDRWGNRNITPSSPALGFNASFEKEDATNRLYAPGDLALADDLRRIRYDKAGNQTRDTFTGYGDAFFDAENHITAVQDKLGGWSNYSYNADGQRTRRKINNQETWQIYGFDGELLAEYAATAAAATPQKEYGYRNGQLLVTTALDTIWSDDAVPAGAAVAGDSESWNWVNSNPGSFSGSTAHQSNIVAGLHQHYFYGATATLSVGAGDKLVAYVYLDPSNVPSQIMLQWNDGSWEHRAYWGANNLPWGIDGTNSRRYMGPLPAAGSWVRLEVPASLVGLEGHTLNGMAFSMWGGRATWDRAGKSSSSASINWLISDHLGTPRMVFDQSGTEANVKRHDYLPFGEELFAGTGGRTVAQGYTAADGVRQQFTSHERDTETGLDYMHARYYHGLQGRFTSTDPFLASGRSANPQSWNRYAYVLNNPVRLTDPTGYEDKDGTNPDQAQGNQPQEKPIKVDQAKENGVKVTVTQLTEPVAFDKKLINGQNRTGVGVQLVITVEEDGKPASGATGTEKVDTLKGKPVLQNPAQITLDAQGRASDYVTNSAPSPK
ncbi:MAG TPA: RHS repeat-associated core domain-containing protein, partial [Pyrinomonadaceae bacterium]|nr:RHS repeat-associated core domain-containing protein [Pyrinomonadaceae bacterium]